MNIEDADMEITLPILQSIEQQSNITQRSLSQRLGLALGLINTYLKHCLSKGLIKIEQIPANRYLYYLTPKGFAEKSRLTAEYLSRAFKFYREASDSCLRVFLHCQQKNWHRIILCGISDLAEIALLQATHAEVKIIGIYDPFSDQDHYLNQTVLRTLDELSNDVALMITSISSARKMRKKLLEIVAEERILVPDILGL